MKKRVLFINILFITFIIIVITIFLYSRIMFLTVSGTSMSPSITQDDILIVFPIDTQLLKTGDIITYRYHTDGKLVTITHRIVDIHDGIIKTKGDYLSGQDSYYVISENVVGKVEYKVPYVGKLIRFTHSSIGYLIIILIPSILLIAIEIKKIVNR